MITRLPAELRNKVYSHCIADATSPPSCHCQRRGFCGSAEILWHELTWCNKKVQPLPLLLVNKQINQEILGLINSTPGITWPQDEAYQKYTKRVTLPIHYLKSGGKAWYDLTIDCHNTTSKATTMIERLVCYLSRFKSLSELEVVLHIPPSVAWEVPKDHDLARLLPLLDINGVQTTLRIEVQVDCEELDRRYGEVSAPYTSGREPVFWSHTKKIMGRWIGAWEECQERDGRGVQRRDLGSTELVEFRDFKRGVVVVTVFALARE